MPPEADDGIRRRQLLAAIGMSAVAGCGSAQESETPSDVDTAKPAQTDCVPRSEYEQLREQYQDLQQQYNELQRRTQNATFPPYIVTERRKFRVVFETLEGDASGWSWDSEALESQSTVGSIVREFTYSQLEYLGWDTFGFEGGSKYQRLEDYGLYYQLNPFVIPANFGPLAEDIYNRHQTDRQRIRAVWHFVTQLNEYVRDIGESPRFPLETLLMGGGDCEDSAILLASLLYSMPSDYNTKFWYMDADNPSSPQEINHVIVSADTDNGSLLIETTSSSDMTPFEQIEGFSVNVEPIGKYP